MKESEQPPAEEGEPSLRAVATKKYAIIIYRSDEDAVWIAEAADLHAPRTAIRRNRRWRNYVSPWIFGSKSLARGDIPFPNRAISRIPRLPSRSRRKRRQD